MTSYFENQSTSLFSPNIELVHPNNCQPDENLNQDYSTPLSFTEQEDNSKYDCSMGEQDEMSIYIKYLNHQIYLMNKKIMTV